MLKLLKVLLLASAHLIGTAVFDKWERGTLESEKSAADKRCSLEGKVLVCNNFQHNYLPYWGNVSTLQVRGTFRRLLISPTYSADLHELRIGSSHLKYLNFHDYENLTLSKMWISNSETTMVNLTGVEKQKSLQSLYIMYYNGNDTHWCQALKQLTKLQTLTLKKITTFDMSCLPTSLVSAEIGFSDTASLVAVEALRNLTNLKLIHLGFYHDLAFDFGNLPKGLTDMILYQFSDVQVFTLSERTQSGNCDVLKSLSLLRYLKAKFYAFDLRCLPSNLTEVIVVGNPNFTSILQESCDSLQNLDRLETVDFSNNGLTSFNFSCLPDSVISINLSENKIADISFMQLEKFSDIGFVRTIYLNGNDINCTCTFFRDFITSLATNREKLSFECTRSGCSACSKESQLFHYPWTSSRQNLIDYDKFTDQCLQV